MTNAMKTKEPPKPKLFKWTAGKTYTCAVSTSPGYAVGEKYTAYTNDKGHTCLKGRDGYEDICHMLVSDFKQDD